MTDGASKALKVAGVEAEFDASNVNAINWLAWMYDREAELLETVVDELQTDDVFYDVGANLGLYTCVAASALSEGTVVAFEPSPVNVPFLERNVERNEGDVIVETKALADERGVVPFEQPDERAGSQVGALAPDTDDADREVDAVPADDLAADGDVPEPNVVKIDVEGAEPLVVDGMERLLDRDACRALFCELHLPHPDDLRPSIRDFGSSVEDLRSELAARGFDVEVLEHEPYEHHLVARKE